MLPFFLCAALVAIAGSQDWARADRETKRLPPSAFPELPKAIRFDLERRGCTVPQSFTAVTPENVIQGTFTTSGQTDWAVLCSVRSTSSILVFRAGSIENVARLRGMRDNIFLQVVGHDARGTAIIGYSRSIVPVTATAIVAHLQKVAEGKAPDLDHAGIEDAFVEKASSILYWAQDRWIQLPRTD